MDPSEPVVLRLVDRGPIFHGGMISTEFPAALPATAPNRLPPGIFRRGR